MARVLPVRSVQFSGRTRAASHSRGSAFSNSTPYQPAAGSRSVASMQASVKRTGLGLRGFPNHTHFRLEDPRVWEWDGCLIGMIVE